MIFLLSGIAILAVSVVDPVALNVFAGFFATLALGFNSYYTSFDIKWSWRIVAVSMLAITFYVITLVTSVGFVWWILLIGTLLYVVIEFVAVKTRLLQPPSPKLQN